MNQCDNPHTYMRCSFHSEFSHLVTNKQTWQAPTRHILKPSSLALFPGIKPKYTYTHVRLCFSTKSTMYHIISCHIMRFSTGQSEENWRLEMLGLWLVWIESMCVFFFLVLSVFLLLDLYVHILLLHHCIYVMSYIYPIPYYISSISSIFSLPRSSIPEWLLDNVI